MLHKISGHTHRSPKPEIISTLGHWTEPEIMSTSCLKLLVIVVGIRRRSDGRLKQTYSGTNTYGLYSYNSNNTYLSSTHICTYILLSLLLFMLIRLFSCYICKHFNMPIHPYQLHVLYIYFK